MSKLNLNSPVVQLKNGEPKKRISANVDAPLADKFKKHLNKNGLIMNHVLTDLIKDYLNEQKK